METERINQLLDRLTTLNDYIGYNEIDCTRKNEIDAILEELRILTKDL